MQDGSFYTPITHTLQWTLMVYIGHGIDHFKATYCGSKEIWSHEDREAAL